jgi:hypothetical protein
MKPSSPWKNFAQRTLALTLTVLLCGVPEVLAQTSQSTQSSQAQPAQQQASQQQNGAQQQQAPPKSGQSQTLDVDPSKGPLQPVTPASPDNQLPSAPSASQPQQSVAPSPQKTAPPAPQGVAVAGEAKTNGGPASEPAGTAIAPAKQRQMRSLLIKIGAIGAGAAALGAIYGLTRSTPSHPGSSTAAAGTTVGH